MWVKAEGVFQILNFNTSFCLVLCSVIRTEIGAVPFVLDRMGRPCAEGNMVQRVELHLGAGHKMTT